MLNMLNMLNQKKPTLKKTLGDVEYVQLKSHFHKKVSVNVKYVEHVESGGTSSTP